MRVRLALVAGLIAPLLVLTVPVSAVSTAGAVQAAEIVAAAGANAVLGFGSAAGVAPLTVPPGSAPATAMASTPDAAGYWLVASDGAVFTAGDARFFGSANTLGLAAPITGIVATTDGDGYWLIGGDGGVFNFGDAPFVGSLAGTPIPTEIVGGAATADGRGLWLAGADGTVRSVGSATAPGQVTGPLAGRIVGIAASPDHGGYWLVAQDGGVFAFGDAAFAGSLGAIHLQAPITGMAPTADGRGYWLVAQDGGVFTLGDATFAGSDGGAPGPDPAVAIAGRPGGYWMAFGRDPFDGIGPNDNVTAAVYDIATGRTYVYNPGLVEHTASTVKVDILATLLRQQPVLTPAEQGLAVPMIEESLDSAADSLWVQTGGPGPVGATESALGMGSTTPATDGFWGKTTTTALDRLAMVRAVVLPEPVLSDASRGYILGLMEHITPAQDWGVTGGVPADVTVALKNGFSIINGGWQINSMGWIDGHARDYLMAVLTQLNPGEVAGIRTADAYSSAVWNAM